MPFHPYLRAVVLRTDEGHALLLEAIDEIDESGSIEEIAARMRAWKCDVHPSERSHMDRAPWEEEDYRDLVRTAEDRANELDPERGSALLAVALHGPVALDHREPSTIILHADTMPPPAPSPYPVESEETIFNPRADDE